MINKKILKMMLTVCFYMLVHAVSESRTHAVEQEYGEAGFKENCAECHIGGGNIVNPKKTLSEKDRNTNGIKTGEDIVKIMRKPGEGMTQFDEKTISENDARKIAEYIIRNFR
jgi:cytochrome c6